MRDISQYESAYLADYGFESVLVSYRRRLLLERLSALEPRNVVEVGCGDELLYAHYVAQGRNADKWIIVEPAERFAEGARAQMDDLRGLEVIQGFLEDEIDTLRSSLPTAPDVVICSGLLHEVSDARGLLARLVDIMGSNTVLHVNVPNARSFHRRLARSMGLITDLTQPSARNQQLQQHRVYDAASLEADLIHAGLQPTCSGGYLVKPFTHAQMELVVGGLGPAVMDGLYELGKASAEWACEIYAEARKAR